MLYSSGRESDAYLLYVMYLFSSCCFGFDLQGFVGVDGDKMHLLKLWENPCVGKVSPAVFELGCFINYCGIASLAGLRVR